MIIFRSVVTTEIEILRKFFSRLSLKSAENEHVVTTHIQNYGGVVHHTQKMSKKTNNNGHTAGPSSSATQKERLLFVIHIGLIFSNNFFVGIICVL